MISPISSIYSTARGILSICLTVSLPFIFRVIILVSPCLLIVAVFSELSGSTNNISLRFSRASCLAFLSTYVPLLLRTSSCFFPLRSVLVITGGLRNAASYAAAVPKVFSIVDISYAAGFLSSLVSLFLKSPKNARSSSLNISSTCMLLSCHHFLSCFTCNSTKLVLVYSSIG